MITLAEVDAVMAEKLGRVSPLIAQLMGCVPQDLAVGAHFAAVAAAVGPPVGWSRAGMIVTLRGYVTGDAAAVGATIAVLPPEASPEFFERFVVQVGPGGAISAGFVRVGPDGQIVYTGGAASTFVSLSGISFRVA